MLERSADDMSDIVPAGLADEASVDAAGRRRTTGIDGVCQQMLGPLHADHRGSLLEVIDTRDAFWAEPIVYAYRIVVRPSRIKGWGMHRIQADRYITVSGRVRVVLFDGRTNSPTYHRFAEFQFTDETPGALLIPPGVWHADQNIGDTDVVVLNFPTHAYDKEQPDKYRINVASGEIAFDWELRDS